MHTKQLHELFAGLERAHGTYQVDHSEDSTRGKVSGKALTLSEPVTLDLWQKHIDGTRSLGIVPIRDDGTCSWACIDIDEYGGDVPRTATDFINEHNLPLVVCRSKSGGAHVFVFFKEPIPCNFVRAKLDKIGAAMGYPGVEVFPKQSRLDAGKNEIGNWLNMPYFDASSQDCDRYGYNEKHEELAIGEFIAFAKSRALTKDEFTKLKAPELEHPFEDGPPCLQALSRSGVAEGGRNNAMFQFAVYAKKKYGEDYEQHIEEYNAKYFDPSISPREMRDTIYKSFDRRDYGGYKCEEQPMASVCNRQECLRRRYGIGGDQREREAAELTRSLGNLRCFRHVDKKENPLKDGEGQYYLLNFQDETIELTTEELLDPRRFAKKVYTATFVVMPRLPQHQWDHIVRDLSEEIQVVHLPYETSPTAIIISALHKFIAFHEGAADNRDVAAGKVLQRDGYYYMVPETFLEEMEAARGQSYKRTEVWNKLKREGVERHRTSHTTPEGERVSFWCWKIPEDLFEAEVEPDLKLPNEDDGEAEF